MNIRIDYLIIDPQNDFINLPDTIKQAMGFEPALPVPGSWEDSQRTGDFINRMRAYIESIIVTLDSHYNYDGGHPMFWVDKEGNHPSAFTPISATQIEAKEWVPVDSSKYDKMLSYARELEAKGLYQIFIWPPHCLIGSMGHAVVKPIFDAITEWETKEIARVNFFSKGQNPYTEHYGAIEAEVPENDDDTTRTNRDLIKMFENSDLIFLSGQALSHCVNRTVTQLADNFGDENIKKLVLLRDTCSSVPGFEDAGEDFIQRLTARGMRVCNTDDVEVRNGNVYVKGELQVAEQSVA